MLRIRIRIWIASLLVSQIRIRIILKSRIRIRIKRKSRKLCWDHKEAVGSQPGAVKAHNGAVKTHPGALGGTVQCRSVVADSHLLVEELDPDPDPDPLKV